MRRMKANVPFIPDTDLEALANTVLAKAVTKGIRIGFPVPVEAIAERVLDLDMDWITLEPGVLAQLDILEWKIQPNKLACDFFARVPGAYNYTIAHEILHALVHIEHVDPSQAALGLMLTTPLPRQHTTPQVPSQQEARREYQAQRFAAFLTMPKQLLLEKIDGLDLCDLVVLRQVANDVGVSLEAMKIRLQSLNRLYELDGRFYPSKEDARGQGRLF